MWKRIAEEKMAICFMENEILEPINSENEVKKNSDSFEGKRISENQFRMGKHKEMGNGKCAMMRGGGHVGVGPVGTIEAALLVCGCCHWIFTCRALGFGPFQGVSFLSEGKFYSTTSVPTQKTFLTIG